MKKLADTPGFLLLGTGLGLGLNFPLGKLAMAAGVSPPLWAALISAGAGLVLLVLAWSTEAWPTDRVALFRFSMLSGFLSFVMPNLITFTVIPKIGSGLAGLMFAISPMMTAFLSWIANVRPPNRLGMIGLGLGFIGAVVIVLGRDGGFGFHASPWLLLALCVPLFLAAGNLYRSMGWPEGAGPKLLGSLTNLCAVPMLLVIALALYGEPDFSPLMSAPGVAVAQLVTSSLMFTMFFRLQQVGGPTYLSQIGYVGATVGLFAGVVFLGERYPVEVWIGAAIIAVGIAISTYSTRRP